MTTAYVSHPVFALHEVPVGHPECPARLSAIDDQLRADGLYDLIEQVEAPEATDAEILRAHSPELLSLLQEVSTATGSATPRMVSLDEDTYMSPRTLDAARRAAGAVVRASEMVLSGSVSNAFCAVRPPGHHAERDQAMGFCFFNNVAVGAAHALAECGLERVAILDFDVHHGNGTEDIFAGDERVLFCSTFQHPFYPARGGGSEHDNIVNVPLAAGSGSAQFREAISRRWLPALKEFGPQMLFVSAGFDGHLEDSMSQLELGDGDYRWVTHVLLEVAEEHAGGRVVSCLEGGYALAALGRCVSQHVRLLAGLDPGSPSVSLSAEDLAGG